MGLLSTSPACLDKSDWGETTEADSYTGREGDEDETDEEDEEELWEIEETEGEGDEMGGGLEGVEMRGGGVGLDTLLEEEKEDGDEGVDAVIFAGTGGEGEGLEALP